jgi:hypothetical protein
MKNIKYLALLLFSITLLISCGQDGVDSVTNPGELNPTSEVNVGFVDSNYESLVLESGAPAVEFTIGTNVNPLGVPVTITFTMSSSDGSPDAVAFPQTAVIDPEETSVDVQVAFSNDDVPEAFIAEYYTFEILDVEFGGSNDYYLTPGELTREIAVIDTEPEFTTPPGSVEIVMTWDDFFTDLDCFLVSGAGNLIDSSQGVTTTESLTLPVDEYGVFGIYVQEWYNSYPATYDLNITFPDGRVETFTDVVISAESYQFAITKGSLGAVDGYSITQL